MFAARSAIVAPCRLLQVPDVGFVLAPAIHPRVFVPLFAIPPSIVAGARVPPKDDECDDARHDQRGEKGIGNELTLID
jgi:hypothetical protein